MADVKTKESNRGLERVANDMHISQTTGGVYETTRKEVEPDALQQYNVRTGIPWAKWGHDDNYPQRLIDAIMADPSSALLEKIRAMIWGRGIMFFSRSIDEKGNEKITIIDETKLPKEIIDWMWTNKFKKFLQGCIADFVWWHSFPVQYIFNSFGKVLNVKWQRQKNVRPELKNPETGNIDNYYLSGFFGIGSPPSKNYYAIVPSIDVYNDDEKRSGVYVHQLLSIDKDYFPQPAWHAITRWLYVASKIPRWILANIDNSINLKYHVKIPLAYFLQRHPEEAYKTTEERNKAIQEDEDELYTKIDNYLAGEKNVHKAFYSKVAVDDQGKPIPGWEIIAIDNKIQDEAWLKAYGTASMAITSGIGLSPSIGGQILPNGLGSGSGSDLREQFNFYIQVMTILPRETVLEVWEVVKRRNGWPVDIHLGFRDVILQSIDQNKSGAAKQNEETPTTENKQ